MSRTSQGHYREKHSSDQKIDSRIAEAVKERSSKGEISCAVAFTIVEDLEVSPADVGQTADLLEIRIVKCQLGLYGYRPEKKIVEPAESVSTALEKAIGKAMVDDRLPCSGAWKIAEHLGLRKMEVSAACETLNIKISPCQLGAF